MSGRKPKSIISSLLGEICTAVANRTEATHDDSKRRGDEGRGFEIGDNDSSSRPQETLEAEKAEEGVGKVSSKAKSSPKQASNNSRKRKQSSAASASKKQSPRKRTVMKKFIHADECPVKHVYHDYAAIPDSEEFECKKRGGVAEGHHFPEKLMNMLDKASILHPDTVSWCSHGRAFKVRKPEVFTNEVMGTYFKQSSKWTSFQRQLSLYGFRRITHGEDAGAYYHEFFLRGRPLLCKRIQRQRVNGTGVRQPTDITTEPNFYDSISEQIILSQVVVPWVNGFVSCATAGKVLQMMSEVFSARRHSIYTQTGHLFLRR